MSDHTWDRYNRPGDEVLADETWDKYAQDDEFSETPIPFEQKRWWSSGGVGPLPDPDPYHERHTPLPDPKEAFDPYPLWKGEKKVNKPPRQDVLEEAVRLITGDRNNTYGPPTQDFRRTAEALTAMGYRRLDAEGNELPLVPSDVAIIVAMVKISRLMHQRGKRDNWADLAGYAGCGFECSTEE